MLFFEAHREFVHNDNRKDRANTPVTPETLTYKHEAMAPISLVNGKTILDLGSCIGATGHWCLSHGAKKYTGIEFQQEYVDLSTLLLSNHWSSEKFSIVKNDIEDFLRTCQEKYDIVFACGVIYGFLNLHEILTLICSAANQSVIIDTMYPNEMPTLYSSIIEIPAIQLMVKAGGGKRSYEGIGSRPSPVALKRLMKNLGFNTDGKSIYPKKLQEKNVHDAYHDLLDREIGIKTPSRFIMKFDISGTKIDSVNESLLKDINIGRYPPMHPLTK